MFGNYILPTDFAFFITGCASIMEVRKENILYHGTEYTCDVLVFRSLFSILIFNGT